MSYLRFKHGLMFYFNNFIPMIYSDYPFYFHMNDLKFQSNDLFSILMIVLNILVITTCSEYLLSMICSEYFNDYNLFLMNL